MPPYQSNATDLTDGTWDTSVKECQASYLLTMSALPGMEHAGREQLDDGNFE